MVTVYLYSTRSVILACDLVELRFGGLARYSIWPGMLPGKPYSTRLGDMGPKRLIILRIALGRLRNGHRHSGGC